MKSRATKRATKKGKRAEPADWTVMVYLAGDNSLTDECVYSLTEMKKAIRKNARINVIAQFDPRDNYLPTSRLSIPRRDSRTGTLGDAIFDTAGRRFRTAGPPRFKVESQEARALAEKIKAVKAREEMIEADAYVKGLLANADIAADGSNANESDTDTGDPRRLYDFISLGIERFPGLHYMVVLSGHGAGTEQNFLLKDNSSGRALTITQLRRVFEQLQMDREAKEPENHDPIIDILGMDACCMSMAEIAYELRGSVKTVVASESYSPAAGWPYREILGALDSKFSGPRHRGSQDVHAEFAKAIVDEFINFYADYTLGGLSVDQAALTVDGAVKLKDEVKELARALSVALNDGLGAKAKATKLPVKSFKDALILAHWEAQSYSGELFVDLCNLCECLLKHYRVGDVAKACRSVIRFLKSEEFVLCSSYSGPAYQYSNGVSIYFPWANVTPFYKENLLFAKDSNWGDFLELYTNATRLPVRIEHRISKQTERVLDANTRTEVIRANSGTRRRFRQVEGRQVEGRQVEGKGSENPVSSMRNPPIVYLPDERIRAKVPLIKAQRKLFID